MLSLPSLAPEGDLETQELAAIQASPLALRRREGSPADSQVQPKHSDFESDGKDLGSEAESYTLEAEEYRAFVALHPLIPHRSHGRGGTWLPARSRAARLHVVLALVVT